MTPNRLKRAWAEGRTTLNGWLAIGNAFSAEIMADAGFDCLTIDLQHGFLDYSDVKGMFQAMRASGVTPMARAPWREPGIVMKLLDAGAFGVICPMINTPEEAADLVSMVRYPPLGTRSFGPTRVNFAAGPDYAAHANDEVMVIAMIETAEAFANLDAICATPGLDGVYIGPADLTLSLSNGALPAGLDREEPEMIEAIQTILAAAKRAGIGTILHCGTPEYGARAVGWGCDMVTIAADVSLLSAGSKAAVARTRALLGGDGQGDADGSPSSY
ncbi:HpcH/HpaI aldolase family protein [Shimia biformata]|uniref:HpcH/HpaI aldolase family protein n=1 Tax=Shimia biformata TaxID=1294299 RepID=UPI00194DF648|nr:aldolase/citrate lyase family protein [Shimia biformata]